MMNIFKKALREPLLHFLVIGAGLFLLFSFINGPAVDKPNRIVVSKGQLEQLADKFSRIWMRPPSEQEMARLMEDYLRDEVYYREALALGLDKDDNVIRRRLRQKLEFIFEDVTGLVDAGDDELTAFMNEHQEQYQLPPQVSFRHIYLSYDTRQDINGDAAKLLARLQAGENPEELGDQITLPSEFNLASQDAIERRFGDEFARQLVAVQSGIWVGPVSSGFGGHLVLVRERVEGRMPELAEVREEVQRDWLLEEREKLKEATFHQLLENYEVVMEQPEKPESASGTAVAATSAEAGAR